VFLNYRLSCSITQLRCSATQFKFGIF
jgi:hypothetical protein